MNQVSIEHKKKIKQVCIVLTAILMIITMTIGAFGDAGIEKVFFNKSVVIEGTWSEKENDSGYIVTYECQLPSEPAGNPLVLLLQTHWNNYEILLNGEQIYQTNDGKAGPVHLFSLKEGKTLTIHFLEGTDNTVKAIQQSQIRIRDKSSMMGMIIKENLYAVIFTILAVFSGLLSLVSGIYMKSAWSEEICRMLKSLGVYILCAGIWVLTDSQIFLLITQKTKLIELLSFLSFFMIPIPLLQFTKNLLPKKAKVFEILQKLFWGMLVFYTLNYIKGWISVILLIVTEHILMTITILIVLSLGIIEVKRSRDKKLFRVMIGYIIFNIGSIFAFFYYYRGDSLGYSLSYVFGILGFVLLLENVACIAIYEQMEENMNVAIYAELAYLDLMTGLKNRTAFLKEKEENENFKGRFAYIMLDANNLKLINDNMGHQKGDELLLKIAECIIKAINKDGSCYRIGGDEFAISLKSKKEKEVISYVGKIRKNLEEADNKSEIKISAAIGYAWTDETEKNLDKLLEEADAMMYQDKKRIKEQ